VAGLLCFPFCSSMSSFISLFLARCSIFA
jgi:hypothetical protein